LHSSHGRTRELCSADREHQTMYPTRQNGCRLLSHPCPGVSKIWRCWKSSKRDFRWENLPREYFWTRETTWRSYPLPQLPKLWGLREVGGRTMVHTGIWSLFHLLWNGVGNDRVSPLPYGLIIRLGVRWAYSAMSMLVESTIFYQVPGRP